MKYNKIEWMLIIIHTICVICLISLSYILHNGLFLLGLMVELFLMFFIFHIYYRRKDGLK